MNVVTLTDDNFETEVNASEKPVLVATGLLGADLAKW